MALFVVGELVTFDVPKNSSYNQLATIYTVLCYGEGYSVDYYGSGQFYQVTPYGSTTRVFVPESDIHKIPEGTTEIIWSHPYWGETVQIIPVEHQMTSKACLETPIPSTSKEVTVGTNVRCHCDVKNCGDASGNFYGIIQKNGTTCDEFSNVQIEPGGHEYIYGTPCTFDMPNATVKIKFTGGHAEGGAWINDFNVTKTLTPVGAIQDTECTCYNATSEAGSNATYKAKVYLKDSPSTPVSSFKCKFYVSASSRCYDYSNSDGISECNGSVPSTPGTYQIKALYLSSGNFNGCSCYGTLTVTEPICTCTPWTDQGCISETHHRYTRTCTPAGCDIEVDDRPDPSCATPTCTQLIKVFDEDGEIIENALIHAESATHTASCRTGANGEACSIVLNSGDIYTAIAIEYTTLTPAYFTACSGTEEVITARRDYCIQKFNVLNQFGEPIEGAEVECKSLWHFNPKATTNSDGLCGINIKKGINWKAVATKSECEPLVSEQDFTSCTSTITLTLTEQPPEPKDTILKCYDKTTEATTPIQLEAKITTTLPYYDLNNCNITFFIDDINIGSSTSDAQGKALLSYTPSTTGTYTIKALFSGAGEYAASECISTLIVREKYIPIIPEGSTHILEFELKSLSWANIEGLRETLPQITSWMASAITLKGAYGWEALGSDIIQKDNKYFLTIYLKETGTPPILLAGAAFITFVAAHLYFFGFLFIASLSSVLLYKIIGVVGDQVEVEKIDAMTEASIIEARLGMCDEIEDPEEKAKCLEELAAEVEEEEAEKTIIETLISTLMDALNITESQAKLIVYGGGGLMALSFILPLFRR